MALGNPRQKNDFLLIAALFVFELSVAVILMAIYMKGDRSFAVFLPSKPGMVFLLTIGTLVLAGVALIHQYLAHKRSSSSQFSLLVTMNLVTLMSISPSKSDGFRYQSDEAFGVVAGGL